MPKTLTELEKHAEALADRFEGYVPREPDARDPQLSRALDTAVRRRAQVEREIADAVGAMRSDGSSWAVIGSLLGTTGQAAQQRYGTKKSR